MGPLHTGQRAPSWYTPRCSLVLTEHSSSPNHFTLSGAWSRAKQDTRGSSALSTRVVSGKTASFTASYTHSEWPLRESWSR